MSSSSDRASRANVTHPERVLWPDEGITKQELIDHYIAFSSLMLPDLKDRLLTLKRAPGGIEGEVFFQKNAPDYTPEWLPTETVPAPSAKRDVRYLVCDSVDALIWIANQSGVELHPCLDRRTSPGRPDLLVFDLDPPEGRFDLASEGALLVRDLLVSRGLEPRLKTTGGKGLHVVVTLERRYDFSAVHRFALDVGSEAVAASPKLLTLEFKKSDRGGRVLVDVHRNGPGATVVATFSPRARKGASVSFPVPWDDLSKIDPDDFNVRSVRSMLGSPHLKNWEDQSRVKHRLPRS